MKVAYRGWCAGIAGTALALAATACSGSNHPKAEVLGKVIERDATSTTAAPPTTTPPSTTATPATAAPSTTAGTAPAPRTTTTAAPPRATTTTAAATPTTAATIATTTTTAAATIAGESLAPGPYLEVSDGSGFVSILDDGTVGAEAIAPEVIEKPPRTYRTHIEIEFEQPQNASRLPVTRRVVVSVENTSGRAIALPGGFDLHLVCTRSGASWLDLHVTDPSITDLTPGATVGASTTPVTMTAAGDYSCSATLPIVLT